MQNELDRWPHRSWWRSHQVTGRVERPAPNRACRLSIALCAILICQFGFILGCDSKSEVDHQRPEDPPELQSQDSSVYVPPKQMSQTPTIGEARRAMKLGRVKEAFDMAKAILISRPADPDALFLAAECLFATDASAEAVEMLQAISPDHREYGFPALGQIAEWQMKNGQVNESIETLRTLIKHHGDVPLAHSRLALLLNSQGKRFEAMPHLQTLAELSDITRRELGALVTISDQCAVSKVPGTTGTQDHLVEGDLRRVRQMLMSGESEKGLKLAEQLRQKFPESTSIAAVLGKAYMDRQRIDQLEAWHRDLPQGIVSQPLYWSTVARWMRFKRQYAEAIHCACRAVSLDPTAHDTYELLSHCLRVTDDVEAASIAAKRAERLRSARAIYQSTFRSPPTAGELVQLAQEMIQLHRPYEAVAWLKEAAKIDRTQQAILTVTNQLRAYQPPADLQYWTLCGIDIRKYPAPDMKHFEKIAKRTTGSGPTEDDSSRQIRLTDVAQQRGLSFQYDSGNRSTDQSYLLHQTMGGGIGVVDFDRDGWQDVYLSQGGGKGFQKSEVGNQLFRNLNGKSFDDCSLPASVHDGHYGQGVTVADFNQDGFQDLIVANIGPNLLYRNNGDGTFSVDRVEPWDSKHFWTSQVACADLDGDTLVDLIECNYIDDPRAQTVRCTSTQQHCAPAQFKPAVNRFAKGNPDGTFQSWVPSDQHVAAYSLGVVVGNIDAANGNDIFVANDTVDNEYWVSQGKDAMESRRPVYTLSEQARLLGCATGSLGELQGCMGIAVGDFDRNHTFDMYVTNYFNEPSNLYMQHREGLFIESAALFSVYDSSVPKVGFGAQAADVDCDGWLDLVVLNGHAVDRRSKGEPLMMTPQFYLGSNEGMIEQSPSPDYWDRPTRGRSLALIDYNRDGRTDFLAGHLDHPVALIENHSDMDNWVQLELVGVESSRDACGTRIRVHSGDQQWTTWVIDGGGFFCSSEEVTQIGIGKGEIDRVEIHWPSGLTEQFEDLSANRRYLIVESKGQAYER